MAKLPPRLRRKRGPNKRVIEPGLAKAERHERFCLEYIKEKNGTQSAITAGYSKNGASVEASRLLANPKIIKRIRVLLDEQAARVLMEGDDILREIQKLAKSDIRRLINPETQCLLPTTEWPDDIAVCVASIKVKELFSSKGRLVGYLKEVKLWDKPKPQEMLGRNKKLFVDVVESKGEMKITVDDDKINKALADLENEV